MSLVLEKLSNYWWGLTDENGLDIPLSDVNQVNVFDESPIHIASWKGDAGDIQWLLNNGADANQRGEFGMTPLHYAYMGGNGENVEVLLKGGADPNLRCDYGLLPHEGRPEKS